MVLLWLMVSNQVGHQQKVTDMSTKTRVFESRKPSPKQMVDMCLEVASVMKEADTIEQVTDHIEYELLPRYPHASHKAIRNAMTGCAHREILTAHAANLDKVLKDFETRNGYDKVSRYGWRSAPARFTN